MRGDRFAGRNDEIYPELERAEGTLPQELAQLGTSLGDGEGLVQSGEPIKMDADEDRKPRSIEEMVKEADWLKGFFEDVEEIATRGSLTRPMQ